jgi:Na+-driven multidrug efflux pump
LALPILFAQVIPQISFVANSIFLGKFGELELRVNGVAGIFYLTFAMVGYGLSNGMQIMFSRRAGEGDNAGLAATLSAGLMLSLLCSMAMMMLCLWLAPIIFGFSLHDEQNISTSIHFLYTRVWGLPFLMLTQLLNGSWCMVLLRQRSLTFFLITCSFLVMVVSR